MNDSLVGLVVILVAGIVGSSTLLPMKYVRRWPWEVTWFTYAALAYFLFPWLAAVSTVPSLATVYHDAGLRAGLLAAGFGLAWGVGVVLYGLAVDIVGLSLTSGIIFGCSIAVGSLAPLLVLEPARLWTLTGALICGADLLILCGVLLCAQAGRGRETMTGTSAPQPRQRRIAWGLLLCLLSGLSAPLLNVALALGAEIAHAAVIHGARPLYAPNAVWGLTVSAGALPSLVFCLYRMRANGTYRAVRDERTGRNICLCLAMAVFFIFSTVAYGSGASLMGTLGPVIGWPVYMSSLIFGNNFWGWYTGEWRGVRGQPVWLLLIGIIVQAAGIAVLSAAG